MSREDLIRQLRVVIDDPRVIAAIEKVPRDVFVPEALRQQAWSNEPLPIARSQTISQPLVVARMCALLRLSGDEFVLDVGTGSGYHAALLAELGDRVISIERHAALLESARTNLLAAGIENVELVLGDGAKGLPDHGPFDAINIAAAMNGDVPKRLVAQLAEGGRLVGPVAVNRKRGQRLVVLERRGGRIGRRYREAVKFVPLVEDG